MRVAPDGLTVTDVRISPAGLIVIWVPSYFHAEILGTRLHLPAALRITELDHGWLCKRWHGRFADHPMSIMHMFRPTETLLRAVGR